MIRAACIAIFFAVTIAHGQSVTNGNFGAKAARPGAPASRTKASEAKPAESSGNRGYPFHGYLESTSAEAIRLRGKTKVREILVTADTRIWREGERSDLKEAAAGERVTGSVYRNEQGREVAKSIRLAGGATSPEQTAERPALRKTAAPTPK